MPQNVPILTDTVHKTTHTETHCIWRHFNDILEFLIANRKG
jgi:hypothetical protein